MPAYVDPTSPPSATADTFDLAAFRRAVETYRTQRDLTLRALARLAGISPASLVRVLGRSADRPGAMPDMETFGRLLAACNLWAGDFFPALLAAALPVGDADRVAADDLILPAPGAVYLRWPDLIEGRDGWYGAVTGERWPPL